VIASNDSHLLKANWQRQLDESLEAGVVLLVEGGVSNDITHSLAALVALEQSAAVRSDLMTPWFLIGGDGVAWAMALSSAGNATAWAPLYGGADQITYLATLATIAEPSMHTRRSRLTGLPNSLHTLLQPASQPGVAPLYSSLPFVLASQPAMTGGDGVPPSGEPWLPWSALIVVIGLIISALFV